MLSSVNQTKRDMPVIIPSVTATVTPLVLPESSHLSAYAVRVSLTAMADPDSEWLEFGLGSLGQVSSSNGKRPPQVDLACVQRGGSACEVRSHCCCQAGPPGWRHAIRADEREGVD